MTPALKHNKRVRYRIQSVGTTLLLNADLFMGGGGGGGFVERDGGGGGGAFFFDPPPKEALSSVE